MKTSRLWIYRSLTALMPETKLFGLKARLLRWCGATIGRNVRINSSSIINGDGALEIGDDVWIGAGCRIMPVGDSVIEIGAHCDLGPEVMILTGSHYIDVLGDHIGGKGKSESVSVGDGCWIGARAVILPGVKLATKTLIAAGAVVTKSATKGKVLLAGVPAVEKREL